MKSNVAMWGGQGLYSRVRCILIWVESNGLCLTFFFSPNTLKLLVHCCWLSHMYMSISMRLIKGWQEWHFALEYFNWETQLRKAKAPRFWVSCKKAQNSNWKMQSHPRFITQSGYFPDERQVIKGSLGFCEEVSLFRTQNVTTKTSISLLVSTKLDLKKKFPFPAMVLCFWDRKSWCNDRPWCEKHKLNRAREHDGH